MLSLSHQVYDGTFLSLDFGAKHIPHSTFYFLHENSDGHNFKSRSKTSPIYNSGLTMRKRVFLNGGQIWSITDMVLLSEVTLCVSIVNVA